MKRVFWVLMLTMMIFCALLISSYSYAEEKKVEIKDGVIYFPEKDFQTVSLSKLTLSFPPDCPQELLNIKGKIFRGELTRVATGRRGTTYTIVTYLIPLGYNSDAKEMIVYLVMEKGYGKEYETKPVQGLLKGLFDLQNGSVLRWVLSPGVNIMTQEYRLSFLKNGNLRIMRSDGFSADYSPVGHLPEESRKSDTPS